MRQSTISTSSQDLSRILLSLLYHILSNILSGHWLGLDALLELHHDMVELNSETVSPVIRGLIRLSFGFRANLPTTRSYHTKSHNLTRRKAYHLQHKRNVTARIIGVGRISYTMTTYHGWKHKSRFALMGWTQYGQTGRFTTTGKSYIPLNKSDLDYGYVRSSLDIVKKIIMDSTEGKCADVWYYQRKWSRSQTTTINTLHIYLPSPLIRSTYPHPPGESSYIKIPQSSQLQSMPSDPSWLWQVPPRLPPIPGYETWTRDAIYKSNVGSRSSSSSTRSGLLGYCPIVLGIIAIFIWGHFMWKLRGCVWKLNIHRVALAWGISCGEARFRGGGNFSGHCT